MNDERWVALGEVLRSDFQNLLGQHTTGWLTDDYLTAQDLQQLGALEAELSCFLQMSYELAALETGLTSGFMPGDEPELGSELGGWTHRDSESFSPSSSQISSHFPHTRSESNAASSSYFQQKHSPLGNVPGYGQSAIPNVFNSRTLKEVSRVSTEIKPLAKVEETPLNPPETGGRNLTPSPFRGGLGRGFKDLCNRSIVDTQEVNEQINPELPRSPKGLQELANFLASQQPQKKPLSHPFSRSLTDAEETKTETHSEDTRSALRVPVQPVGHENSEAALKEQARSPKGLKELANFLASAQPQNDQQPSFLPYSPNPDALIKQQEQTIEAEIQAESTPALPSRNFGNWESHGTGILNREGRQEEAEPSSIRNTGWNSGGSNWIPTTTAGDASERSLQMDHPGESWQQSLEGGSSLEDYDRLSHQASHRTGKIVRLNQQDVLAAQHSAIQGNSTQDPTTGDGLSPESLFGRDTQLQIEMEPTPVMSVSNSPEIDLDLILEAIAQEIHREYRRFYGS